MAVVGAYALLSLGFVNSDSLFFQLLNLTGAIGIAIDAYYDKDTQPVVLNVIWAIIAIIAIVKILF